MMTLMKETEEQKKNNMRSNITLLVCLVGVLAVLTLAMTVGTGSSIFMMFIDWPSVLMLIVPTLLILTAAGLFKAFFGAFALLWKKEALFSGEQQKQAKRALQLGAKTLLTVGALETLAAFIYLMSYYFRQEMSAEMMLANMAVASLTTLYAVTGYLLLLPVRYKLDDKTEKAI